MNRTTFNSMFKYFRDLILPILDQILIVDSLIIDYLNQIKIKINEKLTKRINWRKNTS